jgi:hypothetical protein
MSQHSLYIIAEAAALTAFVLSLPKGTQTISRLFFGVFILLGLACVLLRYWGAFPMTPLYMGTAAAAPVTALMGLVSIGLRPQSRTLGVYRSLCFLVFLLGLSQALFPKDFYLPFLKTATLFSHAHLAFTILGKAALFLSGLWALNYIFESRRDPAADGSRFFLFLVLGFAFWTLSMFSGEVWSYLGWGLPVVWDDAVIVSYMATWFFYTGVMHLHLAGRFPPRLRAAFSAFGIVWLIVVNCLPDLGPLRPLTR